VPYFNSRYFLPVMWVMILGLYLYWNRHEPGVARVVNLDVSIIFDLLMQLPYLLRHDFPILAFIVGAVVITWYGITRQLSLIPVLGLLTNFYLMAQLGVTNWLRFFVWLGIGLVIYFSYGRRHSKLGRGSS
jgi:hypothetical protein